MPSFRLASRALSRALSILSSCRQMEDQVDHAMSVSTSCLTLYAEEVEASRTCPTLLFHCAWYIYIHMEDKIRRYRGSPVTHANHEDTSTNVRSMRYAIIDGVHNGRRSGIKPRTRPGSKGPSTRTTLALTYCIYMVMRVPANERVPCPTRQEGSVATARIIYLNI